MGKYDRIQRKCVKCGVSASKYNKQTKQYPCINCGHVGYEQDFQIDKKKFAIYIGSLFGFAIVILIIYIATGVI